MHVRPLSLPLAVLTAAAIATACNSAPSRSEALDALRSASPGVDTAIVLARVWQDGPPWFSCAEVIAKFTSPLDSTAVRDQMGNWKSLVVAGWLMVRDTASGPLSDPGWCTAKLADLPARLAGGWIPIVGDSFPVLGRRRGWRVPIGTRRLGVLASTRGTDRDAATVAYVATVAANANGVAVGADRDSVFGIADLRRSDGRWRVVATRLGRPARR